MVFALALIIFNSLFVAHGLSTNVGRYLLAFFDFHVLRIILVIAFLSVVYGMCDRLDAEVRLDRVRLIYCRKKCEEKNVHIGV